MYCKKHFWKCYRSGIYAIKVSFYDYEGPFKNNLYVNIFKVILSGYVLKSIFFLSSYALRNLPFFFFFNWSVHASYVMDKLFWRVIQWVWLTWQDISVFHLPILKRDYSPKHYYQTIPTTKMFMFKYLYIT